MNLAMDQFEALRGYTADSYQRDMDQAAADVLGLGDIADNVISAADEEVEDAMQTKYQESWAKRDAEYEAKEAQDTVEWAQAEAKWQAEKDLCE